MIPLHPGSVRFERFASVDAASAGPPASFAAPEFRSGIEERFDAILRAIGEDEVRAQTAQELIPGLIARPICSKG